MQINLVTNVGNASNLHVLLDSDIQDFAHIILRYTSKILAEAFGRQGDFPLGKFPNAVTDAACNTKIMPVDRVH